MIILLYLFNVFFSQGLLNAFREKGINASAGIQPG